MAIVLGLVIGLMLGWFFIPAPQVVKTFLASIPVIGTFVR
jgi:uncharacterized protein YneF (UPF0154 family)